MKVVLQNKKSKCFLGEGKQWVPDINQAIHFPHSLEAEDHCRKVCLSDVQILIKTDSGNDILLPCCDK